MYNHSRWIIKGFKAQLPDGLKAGDGNFPKTWQGEEYTCRAGVEEGCEWARGQVRWISAQEFMAEVGPVLGWVWGTIPHWDLSKINKIYSYKLPGPDAFALKLSEDIRCKTDELLLVACDV